jgi:hypothetical protein
VADPTYIHGRVLAQQRLVEAEFEGKVELGPKRQWAERQWAEHDWRRRRVEMTIMEMIVMARREGIRHRSQMPRPVLHSP